MLTWINRPQFYFKKSHQAVHIAHIHRKQYMFITITVLVSTFSQLAALNVWFLFEANKSVWIKNIVKFYSIKWNTYGARVTPQPNRTACATIVCPYGGIKIVAMWSLLPNTGNKSPQNYLKRLIYQNKCKEKSIV